MGWGLTREWLAGSGQPGQERILALGSRDDIYDLLAASDTLLLTSPSEGFPNAVLEAMALGTPPVTTRVGECPILIEDGADGFLFDHGDDVAGAERVLAVLDDPARRAAMGNRGQARVRERYGIDVMVEATVRAYEDVLGTPRTG
jgi:glycosyltransferase involved in cell wall biosynthesis